MKIRLRIIDDVAHDAVINMAADIHLMNSCTSTPLVVVRLYEWKQPCITIGYMQDPASLLNLSSMSQYGVSWIRRPTGGRAVLHANDITYSCIFPKTIVEMGSTISHTYRIISGCLIQGLNHAGIRCTSKDCFEEFRELNREVKLPCFLTSQREEIMVDGKKLIGSAQKRTSQAILQHGSIPLSKEYRRLPDYLLISENQRSLQKRLLNKKSICIEEILPAFKVSNPAKRGISLSNLSNDKKIVVQKLRETKVRNALKYGFRTCLPFGADEIPWSQQEMNTIEQLAHSAEFKKQWCV